MKNLKIILAAIFVSLVAFSLRSEASDAFSDVSNEHPNHAAITYVKDEGIVNGYSDGTYRPDSTINRAEFLKIIVEATLHEDAIALCNTETYKFSDTPVDVWYSPYVCMGKSTGIVSGYADGSYKPAEEINFAEAAKIINIAYDQPQSASDVWYQDYVEYLGGLGAIPTSISSFDKKITRGEMAEMIYRLNAKVTNKATQTYASLAGESEVSADLLALADNKYAEGNLPLGDGKITTSEPQKGYIYICNETSTMGGAQFSGPWIGSDTWNYLTKVIVSGTVSWPQAQFTDKVEGTQRLLSGNGLPISHDTGTFPIGQNEEGYQYDRNPNSIAESDFSVSLPVIPVYSDTPYCMSGGAIGIMLTGVRLFNGLDAEDRDAPAHEVQDACNGHPQEAGQYHYHNLSPCFKDISVKTVLGYANDGYPITGPMVTDDTYLTTEDLDECHGITSEITDETGKTYTTYHYVMTYDYPYSVGCYRSQPAVSEPGGQTGGQMGGQQTGGPAGGPPQEALDACSGKTSGTSCSFSDQNGSHTGTCGSTPDGMACMP